ncbi:MAG: hypothetical protein UV15_C0029G0002 [Candidatus Uhrbacteria bacterium GW2011_GWA2_42_220]|nr:MAG: hypothetical protein UV15_C0029G0002 [Candidatus Uhrbacteria bacterium GW2011_GWA2_42_220]
MKKGGFRQLPAVQDFLLDISVYDHLEALATKYEIPQTRLEELLDLADAVMKGRVEVGQMPGFLEKAFGLGEQKARLVASDLAGYRLLPLTEFIPGVEDAIKQWGGDVLAYPELRLKKPGLEDELLSFASQIGLELPDHKGFLKCWIRGLGRPSLPPLRRGSWLCHSEAFQSEGWRGFLRMES